MLGNTAKGGLFDFSIDAGPTQDALVMQAMSVPLQIVYWGEQAASLQAEMGRAQETIEKFNESVQALEEKYKFEMRVWQALEAQRTEKSGPRPPKPVPPKDPPRPELPDLVALRQQLMLASTRVDAARVRGLLVAGLLPHPLEKGAVSASPSPAADASDPMDEALHAALEHGERCDDAAATARSALESLDYCAPEALHQHASTALREILATLDPPPAEVPADDVPAGNA